MALVELAPPPGSFLNGTEYQRKGHWGLANLIRFYEKTIRPWGGWQSHSATLSGQGARGLLSWIDNASLRWVAVGTYNKLYLYNRAGTRYDITPTGLTAGRVDATVTGGYGRGLYGKGTYGTPRTDTSAGSDATVWSLDQIAGTLFGCNADDGRIFSWTPPTTGTIAAVVSGAPTNNRALIATEEGFLFALGAGGDPRYLQWSDQYNPTSWTPSSSSQAGFQRLQTAGRLMMGARARGQTLIFSDLDTFVGTYQGSPYVYGFQRLGTGCGVVSQKAAITLGDGRVAWMGPNGFWLYNGFLNPLESEVGDYVFSDFNTTQQSKVWALHNSGFGEVSWFYPSGSSNEIDSYATWNYREDHWTVGQLQRTCGAEKGALAYPLMVDATGQVYEHETGLSYGGLTPYVESGPLEIGIGDRFLVARKIMGDELTAGQVTATFYSRSSPNGIQSIHGPYNLSVQPTDVLFTDREARIRLTGAVIGDWRVGNFRLEGVPGSMR